MIKSVTSLKGICKICKKRADFRIEKTCDDLPEGYVRYGTRMEEFCKKHLPLEVVGLWKEMEI
jgi:hypothetical protein